MKKYIVSIAILLGFFGSYAQNLNDYKYVIVPEKFEFSKEENQHQLNELAEFLFEKEGFVALMKGDTRPDDLKTDNCLALNADVENNSSLFMTKFRITLEDCNGNIVFTSEEGTSREKDYKTGWHEALRDAFTSIQALDYTFNADAAVATKNVPEEPEGVAEVEVVGVPMKEKDTETPEQTKQEPQVEPETVETPSNASSLNFEKDGSQFYLEETDKGYAFFQKGMDEPFAVLIKSEEGGSYIYNSVTKQGMAYFSENGDLVIENFDASTNSSIKTRYKVNAD